MKIRNKKTGEIIEVGANELAKYGLAPPVQTQVQAPVVQQTSTQQTPQVQSPSGGFLGNVLKSGGNAATGIGGALLNVLNPNMEKNTVANLARLGIGAGELLIPGEQGAEKYARAAGDFYNQRYGVTDLLKGDLGAMGKKVGNTLYNDPVGAALDLSAVLGMGGGVVSKAGKLSGLEGVANAGAKASKLSRVVDPIQVAGKVINPQLAKVVGGVAKKAEEIGYKMPTKILKATAPRVTKFEEVLPKGQTINDFITENNLVGNGGQAFKKSNEIIGKLQEEYNTLARAKTKTIKPTDFTSSIDNEIANIKATNYTPEGRQIIDRLENIKEEFMKGVASNNEISGVPIDKFTNMKTSTIGKASKLDTINLDAQRIAGRAMINTIEKYAPGSKELGVKLQQMREFNSLAAKVPSGINTNLLGILKPSGSGAAIGAMVGGLPGAIIGTGAGIASQNPTVMNLLGKASSAVGRNTVPIAQKTAQIGAGLERQGNLMRLLTPGNNQNQQNNNEAGSNTQVTSSIPPTDIGVTQATPPPVQNYLTGRSPEQHYKAYQRALAAGDTTNAALIRKSFEDETAYQKTQKSTGKGNITSSIDMMETLYAPGKSDSLSMGKNTVGLGAVTGRGGVAYKKLSDQNYVDRLESYKTQMALVAGAINQAAGAGVLNGGEYERLAMKSFPNEYTSETVAKNWFANARKVLESIPTDRQQELQQYLQQ
jgi:hypothetical protein